MYNSIKQIKERYSALRSIYIDGYVRKNGSKDGYTLTPEYKKLRSDEKRAVSNFKTRKSKGLFQNKNTKSFVNQKYTKERRSLRDEYIRENGSAKGFRKSKKYINSFDKQEREILKLEEGRQKEAIEVEESEFSEPRIYEEMDLFFNAIPTKVLNAYDIELTSFEDVYIIISDLFGKVEEYYTRYQIERGLQRLYNQCYKYQKDFNTYIVVSIVAQDQESGDIVITVNAQTTKVFN